MPEKLTFGDPTSIATRNAAAAAKTPIEYMYAIHGKKLSQACVGCKWFVTRFAMGVTRHECLIFPLDDGRHDSWKPTFAACGKHEPMDVGKFW
jgi:hypothetical protein